MKLEYSIDGVSTNLNWEGKSGSGSVKTDNKGRLDSGTLTVPAIPAGGEVQVPHIHSIVCHEESGPGFSDDASAIAAPFLTDAAGTTRHSREFPAVPD